MPKMNESQSHIVLENGPHGSSKFWLDEAQLEDGKVRGLDGWSEQCDGCGTCLSEASVLANAHATKVHCEKCGAEYPVRTLQSA